MIKCCEVIIKGKPVDGVLMGIFQSSHPVEPSIMVGGHSGGIVACPVAVVRIGDELKEFKLSQVVLRYREEDF